MAVPRTVADLASEVHSRCLVALAEAGVAFLDRDAAGNPVTPAVLQGLRRGAKSVGLLLPDPLVLADADVARLSSSAVEWVLDHGELFGLKMALAHWHRAIQAHEDRAVAPAPDAGGWLNEQKANVRRRVEELAAAVAGPYREPGDPIVVADPDPGPGRFDHPEGWLGPWGYPAGFGRGGWW